MKRSRTEASTMRRINERHTMVTATATLFCFNFQCVYHRFELFFFTVCCRVVVSAYADDGRRLHMPHTISAYICRRNTHSPHTFIMSAPPFIEIRIINVNVLRARARYRFVIWFLFICAWVCVCGCVCRVAITHYPPMPPPLLPHHPSRQRCVCETTWSK